MLGTDTSVCPNRHSYPVDIDECSAHVTSGTVCTLGRVRDLDAGTDMLAHPLGVMSFQEELVVWSSFHDPAPLPHRRRLVEESKGS
jgi:hypothetical protein